MAFRQDVGKYSSLRGGELLYSSDRLAEQARLHAFENPSNEIISRRFVIREPATPTQRLNGRSYE